MKIIFFGTPNFAKIILESLIKNDDFEVAAVVTNPDKPVGRKKVLTPPPVKVLAEQNNIPVLQPARLKNNPEITDHLKKFNADLFVVASYGKIIPKEVLDIPKYGCINVHGSILPEYRGASPIQFALIDGKTETGITIMLMDEGMDTGPILLQEKITIDENDNFPILSEKMAHLGAKMLGEALPQWIAGKIKPIKQDDSKANYTRLFKPDDYELDFSKLSSKEAHNLIRGFYPNAYAVARIKNQELRIKILETTLFCHPEERMKRSEMSDEGSRKKLEETKETGNWKPETDYLFSENKKLFIRCGKNYLELIKIQPEGKNIMSGQDFLNGHPEIRNSYLFVSNSR